MSILSDHNSTTGTPPLSVSDLNHRARQLVEQNFSGVQVEGEIADLIQHRSGHWYFTLKDDQAQLRVAMFRFQNRHVRFNPEDGQQVLLTGKLSIYEARGSYQLIAEKMDHAGLGKLQAAYEALKQRLSEEGLFELGRKRALPAFPRQVAIITSPQGAAIRDMQSTFARRFAGIQLIVVPVPVQGEGAGQSIAKAISTVNQWANRQRGAGTSESITATSNGDALCPANAAPDAIIVGRGGGSLEDLWGFNEEVVARAIYHSELPVVSAVGHETDFTIADFVADVRAPTPTAAAELLSPDRDTLAKQVNDGLARLTLIIDYKLRQFAAQLAELRHQLRHPGEKLQQVAQQLDHLDNRLFAAMEANRQQQLHRLGRARLQLQFHSPASQIEANRDRLATVRQQLTLALIHHHRDKHQRWLRATNALQLVSPLATLERGYAIVTDSRQRVVVDVQQVNTGEKIHATFAGGSIDAIVENKTPSATPPRSDRNAGQQKR